MTFTKVTIKYYEVDQNSDTTEGRGQQVVKWKGASLQEAIKVWERAEGVFGTTQQKYIWATVIKIDESGEMTENRTKIYGAEWNSDTHKHELKWKAGYTGHEA